MIRVPAYSLVLYTQHLFLLPLVPATILFGNVLYALDRSHSSQRYIADCQGYLCPVRAHSEYVQQGHDVDLDNHDNHEFRIHVHYIQSGQAVTRTHRHTVECTSAK